MTPSTAISRTRMSCSCASYASPFSSAFWKIVGLLVTPTTCLVSTRSCRLPVRSRSRLMSSSQIETSWADRSASGSDISVLLRLRATSAVGADMLQCGVRGGEHAVGGEAELLEQHVPVGACTEMLDGEDLAGVADVLTP